VLLAVVVYTEAKEEGENTSASHHLLNHSPQEDESHAVGCRCGHHGLFFLP
jgi:hypothetical protein